MAPMHIGINAHLLSRQQGYRSAGIHGYIFNTLANLSRVAPEDWSFTVMVGAGIPHVFDRLVMRQSGIDTARAWRRVLWEQTRQPFQLGEFDLYHGMAFVSPLLLRKPAVVTVYDLSFVHYPQVLSRGRRLYLQTFTARSVKRARRVIAISQATAQDVHQTFGVPLERIDVAPGGYNRRRFLPLDLAEVTRFRIKKGLPPRFWFFLGTLEPRKNLVTLLDAYARLPAAERLPLILAGGKGWDYAPIFERIERHGLQDAVRLPGFIPDEDLPLWYNSAEAFLYPSVFEGFGLPVLEAMACGTPVIVSDATSLPEVAGDAGLLVQPHDVAGWTAALHHAYKDATWRSAASAAGLERARLFSWRKTARRTIESYQRAMQTP